MLNKLFAAAAGALLLAVPVFAQVPAPATHSQKVIIETDMGNDIDDALALTVALNAVRDGKIDLMMVSNHKKSPTASEFIDIVNTYYGYPEIEVAACSTPVFHGAYTDYTVPVACDRSWRRSGKYEGDYPDAVARYREVLASCADGEVVIISLGFGTTLAALLDSQPDEYSYYNGKDLVKKKVKYLSIMAGSYGAEDTLIVNGARETLFDKTTKRGEYNVINDIPAMKKVFAEWPTIIYQNPFEIGKMVMYPWDAACKVGGPVEVAYKAYKKEEYDRPSWDILSVAFVLHPEMFSISEPVTVSVDDKGFNHLKNGGNHYVLAISKEQADALKEFEVKETTRSSEYLPEWEKGYMDIHSIGTGQGDCTFMVLPDGTTWMIDAGDTGYLDGNTWWHKALPDNKKSGGERIVEYIEHFSPTPGEIDYAMLTHFHGDHMGTKRSFVDGKNGYKVSGITYVGDKLKFGTYVDRDYPAYDFPSREKIVKENNVFKEYLQFIDDEVASGVKVQKFDVGSKSQFVLKHDPKAFKGRFEVRNLVGNAEVWTGKGTSKKKMYSGDISLFDENMNSCGVLVRYGDFTYYNCGDLGGGNFRSFKSQERFQESYVADVVGKVTLMKNDHHGWKESSNAKLLAASRPDVFVIMGSHRQHPYDATLRRLMDPLVYQGDREIFITSQSSRNDLGEELWRYFKPTGHVVVRVYPDGKTYEVFVLDIFSGDYRIKYRSGLKTVKK